MPGTLYHYGEAAPSDKSLLVREGPLTLSLGGVKLSLLLKQEQTLEMYRDAAVAVEKKQLAGSGSNIL